MLTNLLLNHHSNKYWQLWQKKISVATKLSQQPWWSLTGRPPMLNKGKQCACHILRESYLHSEALIYKKWNEEKMRIQIENRVSKRTLKDNKKFTQYLLFFNKEAPLQPHNQPDRLPLITVKGCAKEWQKVESFLVR